MLERKIYKKLLEWKNRKHKCLVVTGQRQVGKTYIINAFAKAEYEHYVYINLDESPELRELFEGNTTAQELIRKLSLVFGKDSIVEGSTLIFIDEIQECDRAYSSLKQFTIYEKIDVIASGSLLGVAIPQDGDRKKPLIPMGYEETLRLHPLDFEEFLWAKKMPLESIEDLRSCIRNKRPIEKTLLSRMTKLFREFMIVGGMPEAVDAYVSSEDFRSVEPILKEISSTCIRDINRYNEGIDRLKTMECFESIPNQLSESNKKFMYSRIKGEKSRRAADRYMENLLWIKDAGYGNFCHGLEQPALPLKKYIKRDSFKVYLSDTGMLLHMYGNKAMAAIYEGDSSYNMGAVAENIVAECLVKNGMEPAYYRKDKGSARMELDFVLEFWDGVAVIEVKSGKDRTAPSIGSVKKHFDVARRIVLGTENIYVDGDGMEHYPMFAAAFIRDMDPEPPGTPFGRNP